jgi:rhodanese-related sulfurtransferase
MQITPKELHTKMKDEAFADTSIVVDVRVPGEHRSEHIPSTLNIPLDKLEEFKEELEHYQHVYVHCETGGRSQEACAKLQDMMLDNWVNVAGGISAWRAEDLPTVKGATLSMQRQIMIAAGSLVLLGAGLSFLNFGFIALPLFIGAGLVFAGATGYCGMAYLLRIMPWNR